MFYSYHDVSDEAIVYILILVRRYTVYHSSTFLPIWVKYRNQGIDTRSTCIGCIATSPITGMRVFNYYGCPQYKSGSKVFVNLSEGRRWICQSIVRREVHNNLIIKSAWALWAGTRPVGAKTQRQQLHHRRNVNSLTTPRVIHSDSWRQMSRYRQIIFFFPFSARCYRL